MKSSIKLFSAKGISIYVHFTFLLFVVWIIFISIASGMNETQIVWSTLFFLSVFASVVLHEYGHALVASRFGIKASRITLYPIGGIANLEKMPDNPWQEIWISLAGPAVSLMLGGLLLLNSHQKVNEEAIKSLTESIDSSNFMFSLGFANLVLAMFNLIPAFPMDGGRVFRALLNLRFDTIKATVISSRLGQAIAMVFIISGMITMNLILAIIGLLIIIFARGEESFVRIKSYIKGVRLEDVVMHDFHTIDAHLSIKEASEFLEKDHSTYFIVMENDKPLGTLPRLAVIKALFENNSRRKVSDLMIRPSKTLRDEMPVEQVLEELAGNEDRIFPVFSKDVCIGVINFRQVMEYVLMHKKKPVVSKA